MSTRLKQAAVVFIIVFAAAQFVRPERANPATDARRTIQAHALRGSAPGRSEHTDGGSGEAMTCMRWILKLTGGLPT